MPIYLSAEQSKRIDEELEILRSGETNDASLCQYRNVSCVRCCLPHIGGDSHMVDTGKYIGPGNVVMKFRNFNPLKDPRIEASQYEDSFPDVGKSEMEKRFSERRILFLSIYDREQPRESLPRYMKAAQENESYRYKPEEHSGPASLFLGGSVPTKNLQKGDLPECQLLGFVDGNDRVGCMAHPLAETSRGYDGRDRVGFFHHTGCCKNVGCEASKEFRFLSKSALKVFDKTVAGMSWYEYSRHATSVLVYYLRSYDHLLRRLDEKELLGIPALRQLVRFTNEFYDKWPLRKTEQSGRHAFNNLELLSMHIPLAERLMYIALGARFERDHFALQLEHTRDYVEKCIDGFRP